MSKLKKIFSNTRIWIYIVVLLLTIIAISPNPFASGVAIRTVKQNSSANLAGLISPSPYDVPTSRERIIKINNLPVKDVRDYENILSNIPENTTITIETEKSKFWFFSTKKFYTLNYLDKEKLGLKVYDAPKSNILLGLDLQGGTRVVLKPETKLNQQDMDFLLSNMQERLNLFGLSDTVIRQANDLAGNQFIIVEIAGINEEEVNELIAKQGKFEAKIANETIFVGGKDITYVCRTSECSGIDPQFGCRQYAEGYYCRFRFSIKLTQEAAQRQADATSKLDVVYDNTGNSYLSQNIELFLDDSLVDSLRIGSELKGNPTTDIQISGSGFGQNRQEALTDAQRNMKRLQTILVTGSLPVKLEIIKTDSLSPSLGKEFLTNAVYIALLSELAVVLIVILRYRKVKIAIPIITVITSEILLILGISSLLKQNIDISGIAGIIVAIGTGVDDQIVITDEILSKKNEEERYLSFKDRLKKAFFIVMASYFATIASMIPLLFAGAGLLKGFAITTIIGVTNGVLITR
ncbi:MAG: hypothetical protein QW757_05775, partial [Candidatus Woesearchaeota archaeon]